MGGAQKPEWRELVIVPTHPPAVPEETLSGRRVGSVQLEIRLLADGTRTLPVFSSVARLVDELGPQQPWVCLPMRAAAEAATRAAVDRVALDPVLGPGSWPRAESRGH
jgi:SseB protein N-terminal domain